MKKVFVLILCLLLAFAAVACGAKLPSDSDELQDAFHDALKHHDYEKMCRLQGVDYSAAKKNYDDEEIEGWTTELSEYLDERLQEQKFVKRLGEDQENEIDYYRRYVGKFDDGMFIYSWKEIEAVYRLSDLALYETSDGLFLIGY